MKSLSPPTVLKTTRRFQTSSLFTRLPLQAHRFQLNPSSMMPNLLRHSSSGIKVAIVGGGPGGLTLATILKPLCIPFTVFELDASRTARGQGGMLDIHKGTGQLAIQKAGLMEEFKKCIRVDATEFMLRDSTGKVRLQQEAENEEDPERPEIDGADLRGLLLDALERDDVKWGKKLLRAEKVAEDGTFTLHFADGTSSGGFNLLVGADGTWSRVRPLRSDLPPPYTGMNIVSTSISNIDERYPKLAAFVGKGSCMMASGKEFVVAQRNGNATVKTYSCIPVEENWKERSGINWADQRAALTDFVNRFHSNWTDEVKQLFIECDEGDLAVRPIYMYPADHKFEKRLSGVTLLGDAAHAISPFAGTGVNNAMYDAFELAVALEKVAFEGASADELFDNYEKCILERASVDSEECRHNQNMWLTGKPVDEIVEQFAAMFGEPGQH